METYERTLTAILENAEQLDQVCKAELQSGDWLLVTTANSTYRICPLSDGSYLVSGGWFDLNGLSPFQTWIAGCTWGGSVIKTGIVAACGLHIEFGGRVLTSRVRQIRLFQSQAQAREVPERIH